MGLRPAAKPQDALECGGSTPLFFAFAGVLARFGVRRLDAVLFFFLLPRRPAGSRAGLSKD